jgi:hypothetical protein
MSNTTFVLIHNLSITSLKRLVSTTKSYVEDTTKLVRPDLILLGISGWLQPSETPQFPTMTIELVIALILFLFIVCPYLIGKILSKPDWREDDETMVAELPQWDVADDWSELFPRNLTGDVDGSKRSEAVHKK